MRAAMEDMLEADPSFSVGSRGAVLLVTYVGQSGSMDDLNTATSLLYSSLSQRPPDHPRRRTALIDLGAALYSRFKAIGNRDDLDEAIALYREAQKLTPVGHPLEFETSNNLGTALYTRFGHTSDLQDLEDSITCFRNASELKSGFDVTTLGNLGNALVERNQLNDLEEAVSLHRAALDLTPALHPLRHFTLQNLGSSLVTQYPRWGHLQDLEEAIEVSREALDLTPGGHPARHISLGNLAFSLHTRYLSLGKNNIEDLREAIKLDQEAVAPLPLNHPESSVSRNLALHLMELHSAINDSAALDDAMDAFRAAATCDTCSVLEQFHSAKIWAKDADGRHSSALEAYSQAIGLLPRMAALDTRLEARQTVLSRSEGLASAAASCAIREGKLEKAVEFLETGRAVFWSQALRLRTPLDELELNAPALAERLRKISIELERGSFRVPSNDSDDTSRQTTMVEQNATRLRHLNNDWNDVVHEVRKLDGFVHFLQPVPFVALKQAAAFGPVIMLTTSEIGCDALIITMEGVRHVPVGLFTSQDAEILVQLLQTALSTYRPTIPTVLQEYLNGLKMRSHDRHGKPLSPAAGLSSDDCLRLILERLWDLIVRPVVTALKLQVSKLFRLISMYLNLTPRSSFQKSESPQRLWWCPTGPLTFLPIHAAGDYSTKDGESLLDYAVSSYTSTLNSLLTPPPQNLCPLKMLVVIEPHSPGALSLPYTAAELQKIKSRISGECLIELGTADSPSSIDKVLSHLSEVSMVHFACHGTQNLDNPLESALLLTDGPMKVSQIMKKPLINASLAFLSACETAVGDKKVPDESIHIAAAMLFAGFRGVVGTMWYVYCYSFKDTLVFNFSVYRSIVDSDAPFVADNYYQDLFKAGSGVHPNPHDAARALHLAVRKLRQHTGCSLQRWVPFIHLGH
jgi:tetratricopeptide (TPR) repeat protein